jgi:hypothetical protein
MTRSRCQCSSASASLQLVCMRTCHITHIVAAGCVEYACVWGRVAGDGDGLRLADAVVACVQLARPCALDAVGGAAGGDSGDELQCNIKQTYISATSGCLLPLITTNQDARAV